MKKLILLIILSIALFGCEVSTSCHVKQFAGSEVVGEWDSVDNPSYYHGQYEFTDTRTRKVVDITGTVQIISN